MPAKQLAQLLGCSIATVSNYENARRRVPLQHIYKLADFFGKPLSYFIGLARAKESKPLEEKIIAAMSKIEGLKIESFSKVLPKIINHALGANYTCIYLVNRQNVLELSGTAAFNQTILKQVSKTVPRYIETAAPKKRSKLKEIFHYPRVISAAHLKAIVENHGISNLYPYAHLFVSQSECPYYLLIYLESGKIFLGWIIICFKHLEKAEQWNNSKLLYLFSKYLSQKYETYHYYKQLARKA